MQQDKCKELGSESGDFGNHSPVESDHRGVFLVDNMVGEHLPLSF